MKNVDIFILSAQSNGRNILQHRYTHSATLLQYVETFVWFNRVAKCVQVQLCTTVMQYVAILLCVWPELKPVKKS